MDFLFKGVTIENLIELYKPHFYTQQVIVMIAFIINIKFKNGSMIDLAWPFGFLVMALQIFFSIEGIF